MPGRTPRAAVEAFLSTLNESTRCVLPVSWASHRPKDGREISGRYTALLNWGQSVRVAGLPVEVDGLISFTVVEQDINKRGERVPSSQRYKVSTKAYYYTLNRAGGGGEIAAYHWHPESKSDADYPHLHIGSGELSDDAVLSRRSHVPTGRVAFEHVLIQLNELGAEPVRTDWEDAVTRNLESFKQWRTWH